MKEIEELIKLTEYKHKLDIKRGSTKYKDINWVLEQIKKELDEVKEEIKPNNAPFLEDELADILWGLFIAIEKLKDEGLVSNHQNIIKRALKKYKERVLPLKGKLPEDERIWDEVKQRQKRELLKELKGKN